MAHAVLYWARRAVYSYFYIHVVIQRPTIHARWDYNKNGEDYNENRQITLKIAGLHEKLADYTIQIARHLATDNLNWINCIPTFVTNMDAIDAIAISMCRCHQMCILNTDVVSRWWP